MEGQQENDWIVIERLVRDVTIRMCIKFGTPIGMRYLQLIQQFDVIEIIERVRKFLTSVHGQSKIVGLKEEGHRIILSLLLSFPCFKTQQEIVSDTDLHSGSVSRILTGKRGKYTKYFDEHNKTYRLNENGLLWIKEKLVPELLQENQEESP